MPLSRLFMTVVSQKLNGLTKADIDELAKNLETDQSEFSTSNSQDT